MIQVITGVSEPPTLYSLKRRMAAPAAHITEGNVLAVKKALRHKRIENTMKYIHRIDFQDPQSFDIAVASTIDEVKRFAEAGFQKFCEANEIYVYRRRKDSGI